MNSGLLSLRACIFMWSFLSEDGSVPMSHPSLSHCPCTWIMWPAHNTITCPSDWCHTRILALLEEPRWHNSMEVFLCLVSMKYRQVYTKPTCTPRKWFEDQHNNVHNLNHRTQQVHCAEHWTGGEGSHGGQGAVFVCRERMETGESIEK